MFVKDSNPEELIQQRTLELRASEERFHNIISISTDGIVIVDGFGMILFVNPTAKSLFGRKAEELQGETSWPEQNVSHELRDGGCKRSENSQ